MLLDRLIFAYFFQIIWCFSFILLILNCILLFSTIFVTSLLIFQEKCDLLTDYIKRLKLCIRWFQELEQSYLFEQEKLLDRLDDAEHRCNESGMISNFCSLISI